MPYGPHSQIAAGRIASASPCSTLGVPVSLAWVGAAAAAARAVIVLEDDTPLAPDALLW